MQVNRSSSSRLLCIALLLGCVFSQSAIATDENHDILVLSNRADLISGGDALVEVVVPPGIVQAIQSGGNVKLKASLNSVPLPGDVLSLRPNGRVIGLVTGLKLGQNVLTVQTPGKTMSIVITPGQAGDNPQLLRWCAAATMDLRDERFEVGHGRRAPRSQLVRNNGDASQRTVIRSRRRAMRYADAILLLLLSGG